MPTTDLTPTPPAKRTYAAPVLVVHGDVQTLTQKIGTSGDQDGAGSFTPTLPGGTG